MLFFLPTALAAIVLGWPCQRLNWAWRNVWVTCSINAFVPVAATPFASNGFNRAADGPSQAAIFAGPSQLDSTGVFTPGSAGPQLCSTAPTTGGLFLRNRCRRMLDVYGNLVRLCAAGPAKSNAASNALTPDWAPGSGAQPHLLNVQSLAFLSQACLTPGAAYPTPLNTCPGLAGWFTVVWNACMFTQAPGVTTVNNVGTAPNGVTFVPSYLGTSSSSASWALATPQYLCGSTTATPATSLTTTSPSIWNGKGPIFRTSRCRKALDQFGRTAYRCAPSVAPSGTGTGNQDPLRFLAAGLNANAPFCNA